MAISQLPLNALRAFEATARNLSFTKAARELHVTQGAISQQVAALEQRLGFAVFDRQSKKLRLTQLGGQLAAPLGSAFDQLDAAVMAVTRRQGSQNVLKLLSYPTLAARLLIPLLSRFHGAFSDVELQLTTRVRPADFELDDVDVTIREGIGGWSDVRSDRMFSQTLVPVCSPALLREHRIDTIDDLKNVILLNSLQRKEDWILWLSSSGRSHYDFPHTLNLDNSGLAYTAAAEGVGVAMGQLALVYNDLVDGRLVVPLRHVVDQHRTYFLVSPADRADVPTVAGFREWFLKELRELETNSRTYLDRLLSEGA